MSSGNQVTLPQIWREMAATLEEQRDLRPGNDWATRYYIGLAIIDLKEAATALEIATALESGAASVKT